MAVVAQALLVVFRVRAALSERHLVVTLRGQGHTAVPLTLDT
jgi:hypothetical protein